MTSPRVLGVDASPTASGIALPDSSTQTWGMPGLVAAGHDTGERLEELFYRIETLLTATEPDVMIIESYNPGLRRFGHVFQIGEVGGAFKLAARRARVPLVAVTPAARSQFGCGKGNQSKKVVMAGWRAVTGREYPDDNQCDADILREMGLWLMGAGGAQVPSAHMLALTKVKTGQRANIELAKVHYRLWAEAA
jgi:Holliday junction resolvasome RuvABC endonuclease subunit